MITNIVRTLYPAKGVEPKETVPLDFMPDWGGLQEESKEKSGEQSVEEQKRILMGIAKDQKRRIRREQVLSERGKRLPMKR